jgi:hypothetical protein
VHAIRKCSIYEDLCRFQCNGTLEGLRTGSQGMRVAYSFKSAIQTNIHVCHRTESYYRRTIVNFTVLDSSLDTNMNSEEDHEYKITKYTYKK